MTLDRLITHLADAVSPVPKGGEGLGLRVTDVNLTVPLESMFDAHETLLVTVPRGVLRTGFERPLGELRMRFGEWP